MNNETITSLEDAKRSLRKLLNSLNASHREELLSHAIQEYAGIKVDDESDEGSYVADDALDDPVAMLNSIAKEIRSKVRPDAVFPSEKIVYPKSGQNSDCDPNITKHVDAFLYDDDQLEDLVKEGTLKRNYCLDCGSQNTKPLILISHSTSREELYHIFNTLLPPLDEKTVLDVGSRLGAVVYGAYAYTDAKRIIGVEMNEELCNLQNEMVRKYKMEKRVEIINKRIEDAVELLASADVVILNNVFEFYLPTSEQTNIWRLIRANVKTGARLIIRPNIETVLSTLDTGIVIEEWLRLDYFDTGNDDSNDDKSSEISCYIVL